MSLRPERDERINPQQSFFLSWAQAWRGNQCDEALRLQVNTDPHLPRRYRANGPPSVPA
jgi:putative endopeptidase